MAKPSIFIGLPLADGSIRCETVAGLLQAQQRWTGAIRVEVQTGSWLPKNRDVLTKRFLDSECSHFLCVDSDIWFSADDVQKLLETGHWFISGTYARKNDEGRIPSKLIDTSGEIRRAKYAPGGFLMVRRAAVVAMADQYVGNMTYGTSFGDVVGLWQPFPPGGEDVAFCERWRAMGGDVHLHTGVRLRHVGPKAWPVPETLTFDGVPTTEDTNPLDKVIADGLAEHLATTVST